MFNVKRSLPIIASLALVLVFASAAQAHTTVATPGPWQGYVDASRVPTPDVTLEVEVLSPNPCLAVGCVVGGDKIILQVPMKDVFLHELGHVFDFHVLTPGERDRFVELLAVGPMAWLGPTWNTSADEVFAETFMQCARLRRLDPRWEYSVGGFLLLGARLRRECGLIRWSARYAGVV